ncbi:hypothetical protein ABW21_db0200179 [Orbilia brochopaga]|nr:hypothetical protein ABW21_db0200179 [Drechslerella brochopaga]
MLLENRSLFEAAKVTYRARFDCCRSEVDWDRSSLVELALNIANSNTTPRTLAVIDAIDESENGSEDEQSRIKVLEDLSSLAFLENSRVWLIVLSRPLPEIRSEFEECHHIEINDCKKEDVDRVINGEIQEIRDAWPGYRRRKGAKARHRHSDSGRDPARVTDLQPEEEDALKKIQQHLVCYNSGVIMWVILVFAQVKIMLQQKEGFTLTELQQVVERLPRELEDLYQRIISELNLEKDPKQFKMAQKIFYWVTGSQAWGSLQLRHLLDGLAIPDDLEHAETEANPILQNRLRFGDDWNIFFTMIHSYCGPLVETTRPLGGLDTSQSIRQVEEIGEDWTINLVHQTAKKFLEKSALRIEAGIAIAFVRAECFRYLDIVFPEKRTKYTPFISRSMVEMTRNQCKAGIAYLYEKPISQYNTVEALQGLMNLPTIVKDELERLGNYLNSLLLLPFALDVVQVRPRHKLPSNGDDDAFFLWWIMDYGDQVTTVLVAYLIAYLCNSGYSSGLTHLFLAFDKIAHANRARGVCARSFGMTYGAIYALLKLEATSPRVSFLKEHLGEWPDDLITEADTEVDRVIEEDYGEWRRSTYAPVYAMWKTCIELKKKQQISTKNGAIEPRPRNGIAAMEPRPRNGIAAKWSSKTGALHDLMNTWTCIDLAMKRLEVINLIEIASCTRLALFAASEVHAVNNAGERMPGIYEKGYESRRRVASGLRDNRNRGRNDIMKLYTQLQNPKFSSTVLQSAIGPDIFRRIYGTLQAIYKLLRKIKEAKLEAYSKIWTNICGCSLASQTWEGHSLDASEGYSDLQIFEVS